MPWRSALAQRPHEAPADDGERRQHERGERWGAPSDERDVERGQLAARRGDREEARRPAPTPRAPVPKAVSKRVSGMKVAASVE